MLFLIAFTRNRTALVSNIDGWMCFGGSYDFNGEIMTTAGIYRDTMSTNSGCDSIIVLNLGISPILTDTIYGQICTGTSYTFNSVTYTTPGTYDANLVTSQGCDSIATLVLTITPILQGYDTVEICTGITYDFLGTTISTPGDYNDTIQTAQGCDSIVYLNLTIAPILTDTIFAAICEGARLSVQRN